MFPLGFLNCSIDFFCVHMPKIMHTTHPICSPMMTALSCKKALVQVMMGRVVGFQSFASFVKSLMLGNYITGQKNLYYRQTKSPYFTPFRAYDKWVKKNTSALVMDIPFHPFLLSREAGLPDVSFLPKESSNHSLSEKKFFSLKTECNL